MVKSFYKSLGFYAGEVEARSQPIGQDKKRLNSISIIKDKNIKSQK